MEKEIKRSETLEEAVSKNPASKSAVEALRQHAEVLQAKIVDAINLKLSDDKIPRTCAAHGQRPTTPCSSTPVIGRCDKVIKAGLTFDALYGATFKTIEEGEAKALEQLEKAVAGLPEAQREGKNCKQDLSPKNDAVTLFVEAAKVRPKARAAIETIATKATEAAKRWDSTAVLHDAGPLKKMGRITEKVSSPTLRPIGTLMTAVSLLSFADLAAAKAGPRQCRACVRHCAGHVRLLEHELGAGGLPAAHSV